MQLQLPILILTSFLTTYVAGNYLTERPSFLNPCLLNDPNVGKCFSSNLQVLFKEWVNGVPGLKEVGSLDPLKVKRVKLSQKGSNAITLTAILQNVVVKGLSRGIVKDAKLNTKNLNVIFKLFMPKQRYDFDFKARGRVLTLTINGEGKGFIEPENMLMTIHATTKLRSEGENVFVDMQDIKLHIDEIGGFHIHLDNLFGGQKELEDSANSLFNDVWRDLFEVMRPAVEQIVEAILQDRFKKVFNYVPANYFFSDLSYV